MMLAGVTRKNGPAPQPGHQDEAEDDRQDHVPGEHVGEETNGQHDVPDQEPGDLDHEHQAPERRLEPPGNVHVRDDPSQ